MLSVKDINFKYGNHTILKQITFDVSYGNCVAILGNNGAGKSTLIKCINKILQPSMGTVSLDNLDLFSMSRKQIARKISYVAQSEKNSRFTVFDAVLMGRKPYIKFGPTKEDYEIVENIMKKMGLTKMALSFVDELSGGELQKVMLARALAQQPKVLLLDEPTSNLDLHNQYEVLQTIHEITKSENIGAIIVIHDLNLAIRYCDRFLFIKDNSIFAYGGQEIMNSEVISTVYDMPVAVENVSGFRVVVPIA